MITDPKKIAQSVARIIDSDPVMARQIKEHLSEDRLLDLLEIPKPEPEIVKVESDDTPGLDQVFERFTIEQLLEHAATLSR